MITYHPDSRFLTDFATGSLPMSEAVCVAAHLHYCGKCRARVQQLSDVGSHIFSRLESEAPEHHSAEEAADFNALMQRIEHIESAPSSEPRSEPAAVPVAVKSDTSMNNMPVVLRKLVTDGLNRLKWVQLGKSLRIAPVDIGDGGARETSIYDIRAGGRMPEHKHRGEEITVLLKGSFSDKEGKYSVGDFVVRNAGEAHQPTATNDTDCICLVSLERPVRAQAFWYRLLEPLVQYRLSRTSN